MRPPPTTPNCPNWTAPPTDPPDPPPHHPSLNPPPHRPSLNPSLQCPPPPPPPPPKRPSAHFYWRGSRVQKREDGPPVPPPYIHPCDRPRPPSVSVKLLSLFRRLRSSVTPNRLR